jgi:toxin CptA
MFLLVGAWAYTDVLAELAQGMSHQLVAGLLLLAALLAGAVAGGLSAGRFRHTRITLARLLRCFAGGAMMGWGSMLIPGGNDGLILVGIPLLWPYAWVAFAVMCVSIAVAMLIERAFVQKAEGKPPLSGH